LVRTLDEDDPYLRIQEPDHVEALRGRPRNTTGPFADDANSPRTVDPTRPPPSSAPARLTGSNPSIRCHTSQWEGIDLTTEDKADTDEDIDEDLLDLGAREDSGAGSGATATASTPKPASRPRKPATKPATKPAIKTTANRITKGVTKGKSSATRSGRVPRLTSRAMEALEENLGRSRGH
jgi:hypothetical protein